MKPYERHNHAKCHIRYHLIFATKYRRRCLDGLREALASCFEGISGRCRFKVLYVGMGDDHVHLLVKSPPSVAVACIVRRLKQISTREMWRDHGAQLSRYYWGGKRGKLWSNGYFCSTVGEASEATIIEYIKNQG